MNQNTEDSNPQATREEIDPFYINQYPQIVIDTILKHGKPFLRGIGKSYLENPQFNIWQEFFASQQYSPPENKHIALFLVCSWGKPYSQSYIHYFIQKTLWDAQLLDSVHQVIVSNCGVVPKEYENLYPFCAYDWDPNFETKEISQIYSEAIFKRLERYLEAHNSNYKSFCCYLRHNSGSYQGIKRLEEEKSLLIPNFALPNPNPDEIRECSMDGAYEDCDIGLITPNSLKYLQVNLRRLINSLRL